MIFTCTLCGAPAMALRPGTNPETCELLGQTIILKAGTPSQAWCLAHWKQNFKHREEQS